jgi:hypothetical protein
VNDVNKGKTNEDEVKDNENGKYFNIEKDFNKIQDLYKTFKLQDNEKKVLNMIKSSEYNKYTIKLIANYLDNNSNYFIKKNEKNKDVYEELKNGYLFENYYINRKNELLSQTLEKTFLDKKNINAKTLHNIFIINYEPIIKIIKNLIVRLKTEENKDILKIKQKAASLAAEKAASLAAEKAASLAAQDKEAAEKAASLAAQDKEAAEKKKKSNISMLRNKRKKRKESLEEELYQNSIKDANIINQAKLNEEVEKRKNEEVEKRNELEKEKNKEKIKEKIILSKRLGLKKNNFTINSENENMNYLKQIFGETLLSDIIQNSDNILQEVILHKMKNRLKLTGISVKELLHTYGITQIQAEISGKFHITPDEYPKLGNTLNRIEHGNRIYSTMTQ